MRHERAAGVFSVAFDVMRARVFISLVRVFLPILEKMRRRDLGPSSETKAHGRLTHLAASKSSEFRERKERGGEREREASFFLSLFFSLSPSVSLLYLSIYR
jgi:hypothetical protein